MHIIRNTQLALFFCSFLWAGSAAATVIEFNDNGSVTIHKAVDYLSKSKRNYKPSKSIFKKDYDIYIKKASLSSGVNTNIIKSVIGVESAFNQNAVSPKGAQGLMQLMPQTAKRFKVSDSFDPEQNIQGGSNYLKFLIKRYEGNLEYALAAYNAGEGAVDKYKGIPPYPETQHYVRKVLKKLEMLNNL